MSHSISFSVHNWAGRLACTLLMCASLAAWGTPQTLKVGLYENPPKICSEQGTPRGIFVELLDEIARREQWKLEYVPCTWQACLQQLEQGRLDLMPDVAFSAERQNKFTFHRIPVLHSWSEIYRAPQEKIEAITDLRGKRIAVLAGSSQERKLSDMLGDFGLQTRLLPLPDYAQVFDAVQSGRAQAATANHYFGDIEAPRHGLKSTGIYFDPVALFYAAPSGRQAAVLQTLDDYLQRWKAEPGSPYFAILKKYGATAEPLVMSAWLWPSLLVIALLAMVMLGLRQRLHARTSTLRETEAKLRATLNALPDLMFELDSEARFVDYHSPRRELLAVAPQQFLGKRVHDVVPESVTQITLSALAEARRNGHAQSLPYQLDLPGGTRWFELSVAVKPVAANTPPHFIVLSRDITSRKRLEGDLLRQTAFYDALSQCNQAIVQSRDRAKLFPLICRVIVERAGMKFAWIGMLDATGQVLPESWFGNGADYLQGLNLSIHANDPAGRGPAGVSLREDRPYWCQDFRIDPITLPWRERAAAHDWCASASLPLHRGGQVVGVLNLYAPECDIFDSKIQRLLTEMAGDISFALDRFEEQAERERVLHRLQQQEYKLAFAARTARLAYWELDPESGIFTFNDDFYALLKTTTEAEGGYRMAAADYVRRFVHPDDAPLVGRDNALLLSSPDTIPRSTVIARGICKDGEVRWFSVNLTLVREASGQALIQGVNVDITAFKQMEDTLGKLSLAVEQSDSSIVITDLDANIIFANPAFCRQTGYALQEVIGKNPRILHSGKTPKKTYDEMWARLTAGQPWRGELINKRKDGSEYIESAIISPVRQADGRISNYLAIKDDITARKQDEKRIRHLINFDQLTGLPNRRQLDERFAYALSFAQRNGENLALMFLDLDRFKNINDTLGHSAGDRYLVEIGRRLKQAVREEDTVCRLGGDEFILLFPGANADAAALLAGKLLAVVSQPFRIEQHDFTDTASIGIALYPADGETAEILMKNADTAMNRLKQGERNAYCFFTQAMQAHSARNMTLLNALHQAIPQQQLHLHYQPQISLRDDKVIGAEALLRWTHPELGIISPAEFIPLAEQSGLIISLGEWVLRTAAQQIKQWQEAGLPPLVVAVNLSAIQFSRAELPEIITGIVQQAGLQPAQLELELTEAAAMADPQAAMAMLDRLHERGFRLAIDDFGTGYSSLSYLKRFKVYKLKIDQSFVRDLTDDPDDKAIVTAIINLASSLGMQTIAEGVESADQLAYLRLLGCNEVQGYYFSKPLPAAEFEAYFRLSI